MPSAFTFFNTLRAWMRGARVSRDAEILFLRQQLLVLRRSAPARLGLRNSDRLIFVWLYRLFPSLLDAAVIFKPETLVRWHRGGFRLFWHWKSRRRAGRPAVPMGIRSLVRQMSRENPLWGAPRIYGELLKLGIEIAQSSVAKYIERRRGPPSQGWKTFLRNHAPHIAAVDPIRRADHRLQTAIRARDPSSRSSTLSLDQCHRESDGGVDRAPDHRRIPMGSGTSLPHPRSGSLLWHRRHAEAPGDGYPGPTHRAPLAVAERPCRT